MIGRTAAVDYGRRRIGLAVCDPLGIAVTPLETVDVRRTAEEAVTAVAAVLRGRQVVRVVVGLPLHASGRESAMSREAKTFGEALGRALGAEIVFLDEGLTTWAAENDVKRVGRRLRRARESGEIDRAAAAAILRSWLVEQDRGAPPSPPA